MDHCASGGSYLSSFVSSSGSMPLRLSVEPELDGEEINK